MFIRSYVTINKFGFNFFFMTETLIFLGHITTVTISRTYASRTEYLSPRGGYYFNKFAKIDIPLI